jgi:hypothetical protein
MGIRSLLDRLLGRSAPEPESPPRPDRSEPEETETVDEELVEQRLDNIREDQSFWTGWGLPYPAKLHDLQRLFLIEATRNNVLPLDDRGFERVVPAIAGRPETVTGNKQTLLPGMADLMEYHVLDWRNRSYASPPKSRSRTAQRPPMPATPASAATAPDRNLRPIEIIMACEARRISIGEWS